MLILLSGVSGAGKDTVKTELINKVENMESLPSYTDRPIRANDIPGETYNFVSKEEFEQMIKNNEFYEYDIHHDHYYGTSRKLLNNKISNGKIIIKDIDVNGVESLKKILEKDVKIVTIFLKVPKEELRRRLKQRSDKPSNEEIELRLSRFDYEQSKIDNYDYVIDNMDLEETIKEILKIIEKES